MKETSARSPKISVIIPAFNASLTISYVVSSTITSLEELGYPYEVLVIDDGSIDLTGEVARDAGATVIENPRNFGKGFALRTGFTAASGDIIVTMDADGDHDPQYISKLIDALKDADLVIGSRFLAVQKNYFSLKRSGNYFLTLAIRLLFGKRITDSQSNFRAFKKTALKRLNLVSSGFEIDTEILAESLSKKFKVKEIPVKLLPIRFYHSRKNQERPLNTFYRMIRVFVGSNPRRGM